LPARNKQDRESGRETRVRKLGSQETGDRTELSRLPVAGRSTSEVLHQPPISATASPEVGNCRRPKGLRDPGNGILYVPVVDRDGKPLMPCRAERARELVRKGRAIRRFSRGLFYIRLKDRSGGQLQAVACGVDPGSKREGYTVKAKNRTFLNVQANAVDWVKGAVKTRREMRRTRRFRKTPYRANRMNRARGGVPPSTRVRWAWKLRICRWIAGLYPVQTFVVEDIKARTKGRRRWDASFSPLEVGKRYFYNEVTQLGNLMTPSGWDTKQMRDKLGLKKTGGKLEEVFSAHCVDSWTLASMAVGGTKPENKRMFVMAPIRLHRRQLHRFQPDKGGVRHAYGGTRSLEFKRGSLVKHPKYGLAYIGGAAQGRVSLHSLGDGKRLCQNAKPSDCEVLAWNTWRTRLLPGLKSGVSAA